jgi:hypothetical protein
VTRSACSPLCVVWLKPICSRLPVRACGLLFYRTSACLLLPPLSYCLCDQHQAVLLFSDGFVSWFPGNPLGLFSCRAPCGIAGPAPLSACGLWPSFSSLRSSRLSRPTIITVRLSGLEGWRKKPHHILVAEGQSSLLLVDPADERETREAVVRTLTGAHIGLPSRSHGQVLAIHGLRRGASLFAGQLAQTLSLAVLDGGILPPTLGNEVRHEGFA